LRSRDEVKEMIVARMHSALLFTILIALAVLALWALLIAWQDAQLGPRLRAGVWICELLLASEVAIGLLLWMQGLRPVRPEVHVMYGLVALALLPGALAWGRGRSGRAASSALGIVAVLVCAIVLRALQTGRAS
jgi:hypothetical protein